MSSVTLPVTLRAALGRVPCAHHMMRRASMRAEVLAEVANSCGAMMGLLLTRLEVEAHRGLPSFRRHPRTRSCSSIFLPPWRSSTNGRPPSGASSALMTHNCRGSIVVHSISKSVEPNEEQKEMISSFQ